MDTTINNSIGYINDVNNFAEVVDERDVFADLDDDPPGVDFHRADKHINRSFIDKVLHQRIRVLMQLVIGTLVGSIAGMYAWEIKEAGKCKHNQYTCTYGSLVS